MLLPMQCGAGRNIIAAESGGLYSKSMRSEVCASIAGPLSLPLFLVDGYTT